MILFINKKLIFVKIIIINGSEKMVDVKYARAYTEVLELIKHLCEKDRMKIPNEKIEFYEQNKMDSYSFVLDPNNLSNGLFDNLSPFCSILPAIKTHIFDDVVYVVNKPFNDYRCLIIPDAFE